jgi:hypothetical protein
MLVSFATLSLVQFLSSNNIAAIDGRAFTFPETADAEAPQTTTKDVMVTLG